MTDDISQTLRKQIEDLELRNKLLLQALKEAHRVNELWGKACEDLLQAKKRLQLDAQVIQHVSNGIVIADHDVNIIETNPAITLLTGYTAAEMLQKNPRLLQSGKHDAKFYQNMWQEITANKIWQGEIWNRHKNGALLLFDLTITAIVNKQGKTTHYLGVYTDIIRQKIHEERMSKLAYYDLLTQLPNRALLYDRLNEIIKYAYRYNQEAAVLFFDLDYFKVVNDNFGHHIGDKLLIEIAKRVTTVLREEDTVARLGGDEFVVVVKNVQSREDIAKIAEKIIRAVSQPLQIDSHQCQVGASIGISVYPDDGKDSNTLVQYADKAMYAAKKAGRSRFVFYDTLNGERELR